MIIKTYVKKCSNLSGWILRTFTSVELQGSSKVYSSVSDMLDVLGWTPLSQRRQEARLNGLAQVPFEGVLVEAYKPKGTRIKVIKQIGHTTSQYMASRFS